MADERPWFAVEIALEEGQAAHVGVWDRHADVDSGADTRTENGLQYVVDLRGWNLGLLVQGRRLGWRWRR